MRLTHFLWSLFSSSGAMLALLFCIFGTLSAEAKTPSENLSECLVLKSTGSDRVEFIRWMTLAFASHPSIASDVTIAPDALEKASKTVADLVVELITERCLAETKAVANEGGIELAFRQAFKVFGETSAFDIMSNKSVVDSMNLYSAYLDMKEIARAIAE